MMTQNPQLIVEALKGQQQQQSTGKSTRVCRHFVRGRCTWGAACRFSHEADRASEVDMLGSVPSPKVSSPTFSTPMGAQQSLPHGVSSQQAWIGAQQAQLQQQRNAILRAAMDGQFAVRPIAGPDGQTHHTIHLTMLPSPEIAIQLLNDQQLRQQLQQLEMDDRIRESGLHYLIGEPSVFWSMIRQWHQAGTTSSAKWDSMLNRARQTQQVDCMFYRSAAGCLSPNCPFEHAPKGGNSSQTVLSMATSNALLQRMPSLGFGSSSERLDAAQQQMPNTNSAINTPMTQLQPVGSLNASKGTANPSAMFQSSPTLDELAAAANGGESWNTKAPRYQGGPHATDESLSKSIWNMLTVSEPQPVAVTTAPSSSIW